jgi:ribosomal protein L20A (L18A)
MKSSFSAFGLTQNDSAPASKMDKQILEVVKGAKTMSEKEAILDATSRLTLSLLYAFSSSIAVLSNTYNHYENILDVEHDEMESDIKREALQMILYQFTKIYGLKKACQSMERFFRSLGSRHKGVQKTARKIKKRRLSRSSSITERTVRTTLCFISTCYFTIAQASMILIFVVENSRKSRVDRTSSKCIAKKIPSFRGVHSKESFLDLSHGSIA